VVLGQEHLPVRHPADVILEIKVRLLAYQDVSVPFDANVAIEKSEAGLPKISGCVRLDLIRALTDQYVALSFENLFGLQRLDPIGFQGPGEFGIHGKFLLEHGLGAARARPDKQEAEQGQSQAEGHCSGARGGSARGEGKVRHGEKDSLAKAG